MQGEDEVCKNIWGALQQQHSSTQMVGALVSADKRIIELQHINDVQNRLDASLQRRGIIAQKLAEHMYNRHAAAVLIQVWYRSRGD